MLSESSAHVFRKDPDVLYSAGSICVQKKSQQIQILQIELKGAHGLFRINRLADHAAYTKCCTQNISKVLTLKSWLQSCSMLMQRMTASALLNQARRTGNDERIHSAVNGMRNSRGPGFVDVWCVIWQKLCCSLVSFGVRSARTEMIYTDRNAHNLVDMQNAMFKRAWFSG